MATDAERAQFVREKLSSFRRELSNATTPYKIKECLEALSDALEVLLYGQIVEPSAATIPGAPLRTDENKTRVEIFMPGQAGNPAGPAPVTAATFQVTPEQIQAAARAALPAVTGAAPMLPAPSAAAPMGESRESIDAQASRALAEIARVTGAAVPAATVAASAAAMEAIEAARLASENAARIAAGGGPSDRKVEIFMPGDPNAPKPAQVG